LKRGECLVYFALAGRFALLERFELPRVQDG